MINIENDIFDKLATALRLAYNGIYVTGEYTPTAPKFPCVFIEEVENITGIYDGSNTERTSNVAYEINIFSNLSKGRKTECKNIANTIDQLMVDMGFMRIMLTPVPNEDSTIYRITARYSASVGQDKTIYRR